jgi:hypothetical protein
MPQRLLNTQERKQQSRNPGNTCSQGWKRELEPGLTESDAAWGRTKAQCICWTLAKDRHRLTRKGKEVYEDAETDRRGVGD